MSLPRWLGDQKILDRLEKGGRRSSPPRLTRLVDRSEQRRQGVKSADPETDAVYVTMIDGGGASFALDEREEVPPELPAIIERARSTAESRAQIAAALRGIADWLDPMPKPGRGRPPARRDSAVIRAIYRARLLENQQIRAQVLKQTRRPSEAYLDWLATRNAVFTTREENPIRVTIAEGVWPHLEAEHYIASPQGVGSSRARKILTTPRAK